MYDVLYACMFLATTQPYEAFGPFHDGVTRCNRKLNHLDFLKIFRRREEEDPSHSFFLRFFSETAMLTDEVTLEKEKKRVLDEE